MVLRQSMTAAASALAPPSPAGNGICFCSRISAPPLIPAASKNAFAARIQRLSSLRSAGRSQSKLILSARSTETLSKSETGTMTERME